MAVFTTVSNADAKALLKQYSLGELVALEGISAGIENTNYFLDTTQGRYVLTLFEVLTFEQLPFYIELMSHLAERGVSVPWPQRLNNQQLITELHQKPCVIVTRLEGKSVLQPGIEHSQLSAKILADIHLAAQDFPIHQPNLRGLPWWQENVPALYRFLSPEQKALIDEALNEQLEISLLPQYQKLPYGPGHCDLFRDNVLFKQAQPAQMGGVIDFYFAGWERWIFDVAVTVNDWCIDQETGIFDENRLSAWLQAYHQKRPFTAEEKQLWPSMLRAAALRFWISRFYDYFLPREAKTLTPHDPGHFEKILRQRSSQLIQPLDAYLT